RGTAAAVVAALMARMDQFACLGHFLIYLFTTIKHIVIVYTSNLIFTFNLPQSLL
ncbi:hypothetical protein ACJX0J_030999, partial [Zea mays]